MYFGANTFLFVILVIIITYSISKVSNIFRLNYRLTICIMILWVILLGFLYQYLYFLKINSVSKNGEDYRVKEVFLNYFFDYGGNANVEHELVFEENKNSENKNSLSYSFYEINKINNLKIYLDNILLTPSSSLKRANTYEFKTKDNKNMITVYFPNTHLKKVNLVISYSVKNALLEDNNNLFYYNTFFSDRTDFSFNTNVKGNITFCYPKNSIISFGANSKDFWVNKGKQDKNLLVIDFKNKLPYEKNPFSRFSDWIKLYDPVSFDKTYMKDFSLTVRLDFSKILFKKDLFFSNKLSDKMYSTLELKSLNKENNEKFSDFKFIIGVFLKSRLNGIFLFLFISFPIINLYYKKQKKKE